MLNLDSLTANSTGLHDRDQGEGVKVFRRRPRPLEARRIRLEPGDVVALEFPGPVTQEQAKGYGTQLAEAFPDHLCVVVDQGCRIVVFGEGREN